MTWYANVDYNYRNRYFAQLSFSLETCSRFGKEAEGGIGIGGVKWGMFPSLQLGWVLTNESWFPKNTGINYLLVKAGYDISGNDDISNYAARTSFSVAKYLYKSTAAVLDNIGNERITWEQTGKLNLGLKAYMLNNRLGIDFDFYMNHTKNLLTLKQFDNPVAGITNYWSNGGSLDNQGFEVTLTAKPIVMSQFNVEVGVSAGHYKNKVKSLPNDSKIYVDGQQTAQGYVSSIYGIDNIATIVGQPAGVFYGYKTDGVLASDQEAVAAGKGGYLYLTDATGAHQYFKAGDMRFVDINGDGEISEADKTIIGDPNPDVYGNIFANVKWKNLSLHVGFNYSLGNDIYNYQRSRLESLNTFYNQTRAAVNRWTSEVDRALLPRAMSTESEEWVNNERFSDRWIEDGSYLKLKKVRLSYEWPINASWIQGVTIWREANNLVTLTIYTGKYRELSGGNGVLYQGIDASILPINRSFNVGVKCNL
jgi:hypothetical protein